jgi:hypothetical protein
MVLKIINRAGQPVVIARRSFAKVAARSTSPSYEAAGGPEQKRCAALPKIIQLRLSG